MKLHTFYDVLMIVCFIIFVVSGSFVCYLTDKALDVGFFTDEGYLLVGWSFISIISGGIFFSNLDDFR